MVGVNLNDLAPKFPALDGKALALLKHIGVTDLISLVSLPIERLSAILGLTFHSANKLQQSLMEQFSPVPCSGLAIYQVSSFDSSHWNCTYVLTKAAPDPPIHSTGCRTFDAILGGGLRSGEICEVVFLSRLIMGKLQKT